MKPKEPKKPKKIQGPLPLCKSGTVDAMNKHSFAFKKKPKKNSRKKTNQVRNKSNEKGSPGPTCDRTWI